jgi:hypothetical protein
MDSFILIELLHWNWEISNLCENAEKALLFDTRTPVQQYKNTTFGILY